jgi:hypothetical protein
LTCAARGLALACLLAVAAPLADAQKVAAAHQAVKMCPGVTVRSVNVSPQILKDIARNARQETIETGASATATDGITVVAKGPVLGSMDSEELSTDLACSSDGFVLTATITRSANYHGAVLQNVLWFPRVAIVVVPLRPEIVFQAIWKMRLTNGRMLDHARTPPYPEHKYPLTLTKTLHGRQN